MKRLVGFFTLLILASLAAPSLAQAQDRPNTREGFFIGFGFGYGSFSCSTCSNEREAGASGYLKLGGTVSDRVLLGFESNAWVKEIVGVTITSSIGAAIVQFYPNPESAFFLKGGAGLNRLEVDTGFGSGSENGFGLIGGLGYEARVGSNFSLSPYANYVWGSINDESTNMFQLGLGLIWH